MGSLPGQASGPGALLADVAAITVDDFALDGGDVETSLDLVAVAVKR